jgi:restriction system protein
MEIDLWEIIKGMVPFFLSLWPVWVILLIGVVIKIIFIKMGQDIDEIVTHRRFKKGEKWRSDRDFLQWLKGMQPSEFEKYIADLFIRLGYSAKSVGRSHDEGIDVIAEKDGIKSYIQCKKFITSKVPVGAVRDFYGALADHLANGKGYFITTNTFTLEAEKFAEDKPIELVDGPKLMKYVKLANVERPSDTMVCPKCGGKLVERESKFGKFIGCGNYPKCNYTSKLT